MLINTLLGMRIDLRRRRPLLANTTGGLSGPAVFPVALAAVYRTASRVKIPIVGCGGISSADDVIEMMQAGAVAVEIGAAGLKDPLIFEKIIRALPERAAALGFERLADAIGCCER